MTDEHIKNNIAKNIINLRKDRNITQSDLAEALNYSDKSVSKWERCEGTPDIFVLYKIADFFGVTVNDLIGYEIKIQKPQKETSNRKKIIIPLLSVGLDFFVSSIIFLALKIFFPTFAKSWLIFIYAIPIAFIILVVFSAIWWRLSARCCCVSGLVWSLALSFFLTVNAENSGFIFIAASIFQALIVLWYILHRKH